jgi:hypothetical protein
LDWTEHLIINNKCHNDNDAAAGTDTLAVRACVCVLADGGDEGGSSYGTCVVFIGGGEVGQVIMHSIKHGMTRWIKLDFQILSLNKSSLMRTPQSISADRKRLSNARMMASEHHITMVSP